MNSLKFLQKSNTIRPTHGGGAQLKPRGEFEDIPRARMREMGQEYLRTLPVLVEGEVDSQSGVYIQFSTFLPSENKPLKAHEVYQTAERLELRIVEDCDDEEQIKSSSALCNADGVEPLEMMSEKLHFGYYPDSDDSEEDEEQIHQRIEEEEFSQYAPINTVPWENEIQWGSIDDDFGYHHELKTYGSEKHIKVISGIVEQKENSVTKPTTDVTPVIPIAPSQDSDSSSSDDDDDGIDWSVPASTSTTGATGGASAAAKPVHPATVVTMPELYWQRAAAWASVEHGKHDISEAANLELALYDKSQLRTPLNYAFLSGAWVDLIKWEGESFRGRVLIESPFEAPLILDLNDAKYFTRDEVEKAYGNDNRPFGVRNPCHQIRIPAPKKEIIRPENMNKKQLKEISKQERIQKLRNSGYFRFIDMKQAEETVDERDRLRCKKLPKVPPPAYLAQFKAELRANDARHLNAPMLKSAVPERWKVISEKAIADSSKHNRRSKWNKSDLSCVSGAVWLMEYMEQRPPLLNSVGMSSLMCNFLLSDTNLDENFIAPRYDYGRTLPLDPSDRSPFFAILKPNERYPALCNELFVAPVFPHDTKAENDDYTDYLLIRRTKSATRTVWDPKNDECVIRRINKVFCVGQTEPQCEVFDPPCLDARTSKKTKMKEFLDHFLDYQVAKKFFKKGATLDPYSISLRIEEFVKMFRRVNEALVKKSVERVTLSDSHGKGLFKLRHDIGLEALHNSLAAHNVCQYESLQVGLQYLKDFGIEFSAYKGITQILHAKHILGDFHIDNQWATSALNDAVKTGGTYGAPDARDQAKLHRGPLSTESQRELAAANFVVEMLQTSPWNLTSSYINLRTMERPMLRIAGLGDPSGCGEAISYLPKNETIGKTNDSRFEDALVHSMETVGNQTEDGKAVKKKGHGGTSSDLRKLDMPGTERLLLKFGHSPDEISPLDRWDRIHIIESYASAGMFVDEGEIGKFARNARKLTEREIRKRDETQKKINAIFERQREKLSQIEAPTYVKNVLSKEEQEREEQEARQKKIQQQKQKRRHRLAKQQEKENDMRSSSGEDSESSSSDDDADEMAIALAESSSSSSSSDDEALDDIFDEEGSGSGMPANGTKGYGDLQNALNLKSAKEQEAQALATRLEALKSKAAERVIPVPGAWGGPRQIIKRIVRTRLPTGDYEVSVVYDKRPGAIEKFFKSRENRFRPGLSTSLAGAPRAVKVPTARERIQGRKLYDEYWQNRNKHKEATGVDDWPFTVPVAKGQKRCRACNLPGHISGAKACPMSYAPDLKTNKNIIAEGTKLKVSRLDIQAMKRNAAQNKRKRGDGVPGREGKLKVKRGHGRRHGPVQTLSAKLEDIRVQLFKMQEAYYFRKKVNRKLCPTYDDYVKTPMDLEKIQKKLSELKYNSSAAFMEDVEQIYINSCLYNGPESPVTSQAKSLMDHAFALIETVREEFDVLENQIAESGEEVKRRWEPKPFINPTSHSSAPIQPTVADPYDAAETMQASTANDFFATSGAGSFPSPAASPSPFPMASPFPLASPQFIPAPSPSDQVDLQHIDIDGMEVVEHEEEEEEL